MKSQEWKPVTLKSSANQMLVLKGFHTLSDFLLLFREFVAFND